MSEKKFLFEVSWEVCHKVGGIYTVIRSKLAETIGTFGEDYCLIGPLFENNPEFEEEDIPDFKIIKNELKRQGFNVKLGRWKTPERPKVILVSYKGVFDQGQLLYKLWEDFGVDSMTGGWDYVEPVFFSTAAAKVIEQASEFDYDHIHVIFHEWLTGAGLLYLKKHCPQVSLIFISHATTVGRALASTGRDLYSELEHIDSKKEAERLNVYAKHSLESTTAREADCFATVSDITALEAEHLLGTKVDTVLPNGFCSMSIPSYEDNPSLWKENRKKLLSFASRFLKRELSEEKTFIISSSGRLEFRNKGIDVLLQAISKIKKEFSNELNKEIVLFLFYLGGHPDPTLNLSKDDNLRYYHDIATHPLWNDVSDPIVIKCKEYNLINTVDSRVSVIYVPVYLDGKDGVLNIEYYDALKGCDLTVYASYYEPWGYTPLESLAFSIPTIITDLGGFARWIVSSGNMNPAVTIIERFKKDDKIVVDQLCKSIISFLNLSSNELERLKNIAHLISIKADWHDFYKNYLKAFDIAEKNALKRFSTIEKTEHEIKFSGIDSNRPRLRNFSVKASLPDEIKGLRDLSLNLWWSWDLEAFELFSSLDPVLFENVGFNPVLLLDSLSYERLEEASKNEIFLSQYENVMKKFSNYLKKPRLILNDISPLSGEKKVAYFSMEFGLHESLPIYAGGLGVLAGDHIKSSSDLNIPLIGIGLMYKNGYFKQIITKEGEQKEEYPDFDFFTMPVHELRIKNERVLVPVEFPGRTVFCRVWQVNVGRVVLYLLDTDIPENNHSDRMITGRLYGGDKKMRIEQEMLLGIGGVRLLETKLKIFPAVYHLNEGHSAFLIIERLINLVKYEEIDLFTAAEIVRSSTVFTTHTPVMAGNETFDITLVENYLKPYVINAGLDWNFFLEMGRRSQNSSVYEMTAVALKFSCRKNGVSRLHEKIAKKMWADLWPSLIPEEVPISYITNGVHVPTWLTSEMKNLYSKYAGVTLNPDLLKPEIWTNIHDIPDQILWQTHYLLKQKLFQFIRNKVSTAWNQQGEDPALVDEFILSLNPSVLTVGFARRFTLYKRPELFLQNIERLKKIINNKKTPVQFVLAGKAHPEDKAAHTSIKRLVELSKTKEFLGKIIFLEDYDMRTARRLISGVDLWLNTPRRPNEASGTSGQKAAINGVINLSVLDGWWDEAWNEQTLNGWAIGTRKEYVNTDTQDLVDAESFYDILESEIIPVFYNRNNQGFSEKWVKIMKNSIISVIREFNTHRMVRDYLEQLYIPAAKKIIKFSENFFKKAKEIASWKKEIPARFSTVHIRSVAIEGLIDDNISVNKEIQITVEIDPGKMSKDELRVEFVIIRENNSEEIFSFSLPLEKDNKLVYNLSYTAPSPGKCSYGVRVMPYHPDLDDCDLKDLNLVKWG